MGISLLPAVLSLLALSSSLSPATVRAGPAPSPGPARRAVNPVVKATTSYGNLNNGNLNRDSCTSTGWSGGNVLWTCRDTQLLTNGVPGEGVVANTASWSVIPSATQPGTLTLTSPEAYGPLFYPLESDECPTGGLCSDGTRWVGWPNTGPAVVFNYNGGVSAYAFMQRQHLSGLTVINTPSTTIYHVSQQSVDTSVLPSVSIDVSQFWSSSQIGYGSAHTVVQGNYAYLYGPTPNNQLAIARSTLTEFLGALDNKSTYEYYVNGEWTSTAPTTSTANIGLENTSWGGSIQGTIYYSNKWESFVYIGGDDYPDANFYISTAPAAEGPWTAGVKFYTGAQGSGSLPAYSCVAHPALTDGTGDYIFISWTTTTGSGDATLYEQPLVRVDWE
ncbi:hypothetical protein HMN09_00480000 [Mycena chlorophos]|uniref:DUF4185 domain-containing protein n=1 Tax=Mycena chlorophos TaxID=658473 RepID=A0A8H6WJR3_MYCCL|nr:hypothetical protein HMN09_00480000 [Mycena chlorophos]